MVARSGNDTFFACPPPEVAPRSPVSDARMTSALDVSDNAQDTPTVQSISDTSDPLVIPSRSLVDSSESSVVPRGDIGYGQHGRMHCQVVDAHSPKSIGEGHRLLAHDEEKCEILRKAYEASQRWYKTDLPEISSQLLYMSPPEKQTEVRFTPRRVWKVLLTIFRAQMPLKTPHLSAKDYVACLRQIRSLEELDSTSL